jgi:type II secretory pathway component PulJ
MLFLQVVHVPSFVGSSSANDSESDRLQQMKTRITQMERDMRNIHAMEAITKMKGETAFDAERYALNELQKATDSLNCKYLNTSWLPCKILERVLFLFLSFAFLSFISHCFESIRKEQTSV